MLGTDDEGKCYHQGDLMQNDGLHFMHNDGLHKYSLLDLRIALSVAVEVAHARGEQAAKKREVSFLC